MSWRMISFLNQLDALKSHTCSQKDYVCFDFVPRHHNIIRYRKGQAMITSNFAEVCAWTMFPDDEEWKYDILIGNRL